MESRDKYYVKFVGWVVVNANDPEKKLFNGEKKEATKYAIALASRPIRPAQIIIFERDGEFQEERTYPRSSDPKRYKG